MSDDEYTPSNGATLDLVAAVQDVTWDTVDPDAPEVARADAWLTAHDRRVAARALREAAAGIDFQWEPFVASDGVVSLREHGKRPAELLLERADRIESGEGL